MLADSPHFPSIVSTVVKLVVLDFGVLLPGGMMVLLILDWWNLGAIQLDLRENLKVYQFVASKTTP